MSGRFVFKGAIGCLACLAICGCGREVVPVLGRVTFNGKPLAGAVVTFQPHSEHGPRRPPTTGSVGRSDDAGRFTLRLVAPDAPGAALGEHTVTINARPGASDESPSKGPQLPREWSDGTKRFTVPPGGTTQANFDISVSESSGRRK